MKKIKSWAHILLKNNNKKKSHTCTSGCAAKANRAKDIEVAVVSCP